MRCKGADKIWKWKIIIKECDYNDCEPGEVFKVRTDS